MAAQGITDDERQQMQRLQAFRKLAQSILTKWAWLIGLVFVSVSLVVYFVFSARLKNAPDRYEAKTGLLFSPRTVGKMKAMDAKSVLYIFNRRMLTQKLAKELNIVDKDTARPKLDVNVRVSQDRKQQNLFVLFACARTADRAASNVNVFAQLCIKEYGDYRLKDLENWRRSIEQRQSELQKSIRSLEEKEGSVNQSNHVINVEQEIGRLNELITTQKGSLSDVNVQYLNEELQLKKLQAAIKAINPSVVIHAREIRDRLKRIDDTKTELEGLEQTFTDLNPKVQLKREQLARFRTDYAAFLKDKGILDTPVNAVSRLEDLTSLVKDTAIKVEVFHEKREAIQSTITDMQRQRDKLLAVLPESNRVAHQRQVLQDALAGLEDQLSDIRYLQTVITNDLTQLERTEGARETNPLGKKMALVAFIGGGVVSGGFALAILLLEIAFGRIYDARELSYHSDLVYLGVLPDGDHPAVSESDMNNVLEGIIYRLRNELPSATLVSVVALPGATPDKRLLRALDWHCAMGGLNLLSLEIVDASKFREPEGASQLGGIVYLGGVGWWPVANLFALAPAEEQIFVSDLATLRKSFDRILIWRADPIDPRSVFFKQILKITDGVIINTGAHRTWRRDLNEVAELKELCRGPIFAMMSGVKDLAAFQEGNSLS